MNIVYISNNMYIPMREIGHTALVLHPEPGLHSLRELLANHTFVPDIVFQAESLGPRRNMLRILASRGLKAEVELSQEVMLELYDNTRILPNESLCTEVNFRLMEGAAC